MPPYRIAVRHETDDHPHHAWFAMARTYDTAAEAVGDLDAAEAQYPPEQGYIHRVEDLVREDEESASWQPASVGADAPEEE